MLTKVFAHRGASMYAPENTMPAFELAYEMGADGIETDVHLTKDQIPVLIHDEKINRTTNGKGYVKDFTLNELKKFDAGNWFSKKYGNTQIISLEEFLIWAKSKSLCLNIELKNNIIDYKHLEAIVYEMLSHYQMLEQTVISTFYTKSIKRLKKFQEDVEVALLTSKRIKNPLNEAIHLGVRSLHIEYSSLNTQLVERAQQNNIAIRVYTVNKPLQMRRCFAKKCNGIFTDAPDDGLKYRKLFIGEST